MMLNQFCFIVQVSDYSRMKCFRSDDRFLLLLPCPLGLQSVVSAVSFKISLLICGDIESNPGPTDQEMLQQLLLGQNNITTSINNVLTRQEKLEKNVASLHERISGIETQMASLGTLKTEVNGLKSTIAELEQNVSSLLNKVDELENRSRRNNLIIYGVKEESTETFDDLIKKIKESVFLEKLDLTISGIERCHRLGKKKDGDRPVIVKFLDYREKVSIMKACPKLKGSEISISEDFSLGVRQIRQKLWESSAEERSNGAKVKLFFDKLSVNGTLFAWDKTKNKRYRITKHT
ncbi:uncharacterized protein LOC144098218 [Amblyomma americanum]